jgi:DNA-binding transcriptional MerR regulator
MDCSITEACEKTGLSPRTLRYYEEIGLLPDVRRSEGGRRVYGPDALERLGFIQRLKALGLSLAEIRELNAVYAIGGSTEALLERLHELLGQHLDDADRRLVALGDLRSELVRYRAHVEERLAGRGRTKRARVGGPGSDPGAARSALRNVPKRAPKKRGRAVAGGARTGRRR